MSPLGVEPRTNRLRERVVNIRVSDPCFGVGLSGGRLLIRPPVSARDFPVVCQIVCQSETTVHMGRCADISS